MLEDKLQLPRKLWHVEYEAAVGYPEPNNRVIKRRNFTREVDAGRMIDTINAMPSHLKLHSVHVSDEIIWLPADPAEVARPIESEIVDE